MFFDCVEVLHFFDKLFQTFKSVILSRIITVPNTSCGKVMFLQASVCPQGDMLGEGGVAKMEHMW